MKAGLFVAGLFAVLTLAGCGGGDKPATGDAALQKQADAARASLQEKADALARQASISPPPPAEKEKKK